MADNALHPLNRLLLTVRGILIVIDRELNKQEIDWSFPKNITLQAECSGVGTGGTDPRVSRP